MTFEPLPADENSNCSTCKHGTDDIRTYVPLHLKVSKPTDMYLESKRKASEQLSSASPSKRIKNSHSHTISLDAEGKSRVVPFPEKVRHLRMD